MLCLMLCKFFSIFWKKSLKLLTKIAEIEILMNLSIYSTKYGHISPHGMLDDLWKFQIWHSLYLLSGKFGVIWGVVRLVSKFGVES